MVNMNITKSCKQCGKEFHPQYRRKCEKPQEFCSNKCEKIHRFGSSMARNSCPICGEQCTSTGKRNQIYCSAKCRHKGKNGIPNPGRSNRMIKLCDWCGLAVDRPASNFHATKTFCNYLCMAEWQSKYNRGSKHPRWTGGKRNTRGTGWNFARKLARKLANGKCKACRNPAKDVHHKIPVRCFNKPSDAHVQSNLVVLCKSCHPKAEKMFRQKMPLLNLAQWKN